MYNIIFNKIYDYNIKSITLLIPPPLIIEYGILSLPHIKLSEHVKRRTFFIPSFFSDVHNYRNFDGFPSPIVPTLSRKRSPAHCSSIFEPPLPSIFNTDPFSPSLRD